MTALRRLCLTLLTMTLALAAAEKSSECFWKVGAGKTAYELWGTALGRE